MLCRGETFRHSLLIRLGEIRSVIPAGVNIMALTATATRALQHNVAEILGMWNPVTVAVSPCKVNIIYAVGTYTTLKETFAPLLLRLRTERLNLPRTIIYCRRHEDCADLYLHFKEGLGSEFTEPCDAPPTIRALGL